MGEKKAWIRLLFMLGLTVVSFLVLFIMMCSVQTVQKSSAEKYMKAGEYDYAIRAYEIVLAMDSDDIETAIGKAEALIGAGRTNDAREAIGDVLDLIYEDKVTVFPKWKVSQLLLWGFNSIRFDEDCSPYELDRYVEEMQKKNPCLIASFEWSEIFFEDEEPYKEYRTFTFNGIESTNKAYTGDLAEVTWEVEGYESEEPYKEYERKYVNGTPTDDIRYTGRTKPLPKIYPETHCFCGYPASGAPSAHPGHCLDGFEVFKRGMNPDGTWGFLMY